MSDWKTKLTSRKFWAALCEFVSMMVLAFGGNENEAAKIAAIIMAGAGVVAYIIGEGLVDAASAGKTVNNINIEEPSQSADADSSPKVGAYEDDGFGEDME